MHSNKSVTKNHEVNKAFPDFPIKVNSKNILKPDMQISYEASFVFPNMVIVVL